MRDDWRGYSDTLNADIKQDQGRDYAIGVWHGRRNLELFHRHPGSNGKPYRVAQQDAMQREGELIELFNRKLKRIDTEVAGIIFAASTRKPNKQIARLKLPKLRSLRSGDISKLKRLSLNQDEIQKLTSIDTLRGDIESAKAPPCVACPSNAICATLSLACRRFSRFVNRRNVGIEFIPNQNIAAELSTDWDAPKYAKKRKANSGIDNATANGDIA